MGQLLGAATDRITIEGLAVICVITNIIGFVDSAIELSREPKDSALISARFPKHFEM